MHAPSRGKEVRTERHPVGVETTCVAAGDTIGLGSCACGRPKASCPPPAAVCETCPDRGTPSAGEPISLTCGNTYIRQTDIRQLPGLGSGIGLERAWNSLWPQTQTMFITGIFGVNWRSTYEERVFMGSDGYIKYARADGSFWSFGFDETGIKLAAPSTAAAPLSSTSSLWTVTFQSGRSGRSTSTPAI